MKKLLTAVLIVIAASLVIVGIAFAYADSVPQGVIPTLSLLDVHGEEVMHWVWTFEIDGATCVVVDGKLDCFCPCDEVCNLPSIDPTDTPKETPVPSDTPEPTDEPTPVDTPVPPTEEPTQEPTEECKPGWGHGDKNHCHDGPPGQDK